MFGTFKKIIKPKRNEEKRPLLNLEEKRIPREDFSMPEPEEIRRLPLPEQNYRPPTNHEGHVDHIFDKPIPQDESTPRRPLEPPPMKPLSEEVRPRPQRYSEERTYNNENVLQEILRRLDEIENRIERIEGMLSGRPADHLR